MKKFAVVSALALVLSGCSTEMKNVPKKSEKPADVITTNGFRINSGHTLVQEMTCLYTDDAYQTRTKVMRGEQFVTDRFDDTVVIRPIGTNGQTLNKFEIELSNLGKCHTRIDQMPSKEYAAYESQFDGASTKQDIYNSSTDYDDQFPRFPKKYVPSKNLSEEPSESKTDSRSLSDKIDSGLKKIIG